MGCRSDFAQRKLDGDLIPTVLPLEILAILEFQPPPSKPDPRKKLPKKGRRAMPETPPIRSAMESPR